MNFASNKKLHFIDIENDKDRVNFRIKQWKYVTTLSLTMMNKNARLKFLKQISKVKKVRILIDNVDILWNSLRILRSRLLYQELMLCCDEKLTMLKNAVQNCNNEDLNNGSEDFLPRKIQT